MKNSQALLIVDVQNDFCPGGALAVPDGDTIIPQINAYIGYFLKKRAPIFASRDWHPPGTKHFKDFGGIWPVHCVQNTPGAAFHRRLDLPHDGVVLSKGTDPEQDGYSAFEGANAEGKSFSDLLNQRQVAEIFVCGLATDYCVKNSVLDGLKQYKVNVLTDAIKGVNVNPQDSSQAIREMTDRGARLMTYKDLDALQG